MSDALDTCGCRPTEDQLPVVFNRPGLAQLEYRIGTHGTLLRRMLRRIAEWHPPEDQTRRPLASLTTRVLDDPAIALLDAWAVTGDVLSFYQERIANEGFLRTATERRSVLELAREIGYELNPGVAASTYLVWEVEQSFAVAGQTPPGMAPPPREVLVAAGTKVQSMPGQDEFPQTFETSSTIVARSDLNSLRPRQTVPQPVSLGSLVLYLEGIASGFVRGDRVLITSGPRYHKDKDGKPLPGDPPPGVDFSLLEVIEVVSEPELNRTRLDLQHVAKQPPRSQPALPTRFETTPGAKFKPPDPPDEPAVAPAKLEPAVYILVPQPLSREEIIQRVMDYAWRNPGLLVQLALLGWNPVAVVDLINRLRIGIDLGPRWVKLEVRPAIDITPPTVIEVFPRDGTEAASDTQIIVRFSEPMNAGSVVTAVSLYEVVNPGDPHHDPPIPPTLTVVPARVTYNEVTGSVHLTPGTLVPDPVTNVDRFVRSPLGADQSDVTYRIIVDKTKASDKRSMALAARVEVDFHVLDRDPPKLVVADPPVPTDETPEARNLPIHTVVTATFNDVIKLESMTDETFFLRDGTGTRVAAERDLIPLKNPDDPAEVWTKLVLTPHAPLARSTRYTATLTNGITDPAGTANRIFPVEWSFTTVQREPVVPETKPEIAVYGFREKTAFFGHNAPRWASLAKSAAGTTRDSDPWQYSWDDPQRSVWVDSQGSSLGGDTVRLDREVQHLQAGGWTVFETATGAAVYYVTNASASSVADYSMSGRSSRLVLSRPDGSSPSEGVGAPADFLVRETSARVASETLRLVELPIEKPLQAGDKEVVLDRMVLGLEKGGLVALRGELVGLAGMVGNEILEVEGSTHADGFTTLVIKKGLLHSYVRKTVTMNANVVPATHGETVGREVLGGGDGAQANQRFRLLRPPLTYVSDRRPSGAASTLEIRIDGVRWDEAPVLYGLGPRSRRYIVRTTDAGIPNVIFGDGEQGARPPTGTENIVATYRSGIGLAGLLGAGRLTLLRERPLGISSVTNPLPTNGAADPENRDAAKENAPLTVLTMERIVSLRDFEDFARGFAGIDKAQSIAIWQGDRQRVVLTVAAANADESSALFKNLVDAVAAATEPGLEVTVCSYRPRFFDLEAAIRVDPEYLVEAVLIAARRAVLAAFAFERRTFGQPVTAAEIIHVIQSVPGVVATYLDALYALEGNIEAKIEKGAERPLESVLLPRPAELVVTESVRIASLVRSRSEGVAAVRPRSREHIPVVPTKAPSSPNVANAGKFQGAELLIVNPAGVTITERTA